MKINFKFVGVNVEFNVERFTIGIGSFFLVFAIVVLLFIDEIIMNVSKMTGIDEKFLWSSSPFFIVLLAMNGYILYQESRLNKIETRLAPIEAKIWGSKEKKRR